MTVTVHTPGLLVDPRRMLWVKIRNATGERDVAAVTCAYVPALGPDGVVRVAIEVVADPGNPNPAAPYYCPEERLERILLSPEQVRRVRPFAG